MSDLLACRLADELWMLAVSFLPIRNVIPHLPLVSKYFDDVVVWGPTSGALMWREMASGPDGALEGQGLNARVFETLSDEISPSQTALIRACARGAPLIHVCVFLAGGGNVSVSSYGWTALHSVSYRGHEDIARKLLEANADPNVASDSGSTPLLLASARGYSAVVSTLVAAGARINHASYDGWTALMLASCNNHVDVVRLLVANGANVKLRCWDGLTALDIARTYRYRDIVTILESAMSEQ